MTTLEILNRLERGECLLRDCEKTYFYNRETGEKDAIYHDNLYVIREYLEALVISDDLVRIIPARKTTLIKKEYNRKEVMMILKLAFLKHKRKFNSYR